MSAEAASKVDLNFQIETVKQVRAAKGDVKDGI